MKVLQVINSLATGGAEKLLLETIPLYRERGIEMDLLVLNGADDPFMQKLNALNCCKIYNLKLPSIYHPMAIFKMMPYLKKYDLVHVHLFPVQYFVVLAKCLSNAKVKLIFTEHSTSNRRIEHWYFKPLENQIYKTYSKVICITNEVQSIYENYLPKLKNKWQVIKNGVNITSIHNAMPLDKVSIAKSILKTDRLIIQVAGFRIQKDQATLIRALQLLPPPVKLLLVGEGTEKEKCQQLVQALNLSERVFFLGTRMDVPQLLKTADLSILSTLHEGFGLVAVEGMASGKPFIASRVPGLSEVVANAGILFEVGNAKELAHHIQFLLNNPEYYQEVATACQKRANEFTIDKMVNQHIELYKSIISAN